MGKYSELKDKMLHGGGWFTLFRSTISSQISSWTDFIVSLICHAFIFAALEPLYRSNLSVAFGAIIGGIVNCSINYRFTFRAKGQSVRAVIVKFILIWAGSLLLNMYGTTGLGMLMSKWNWLIEIGFKPDGIFAAARLIASFFVSIFWNFLLQRSFVYRPTKFDPYAIQFANLFIPKRIRKPVKSTSQEIKN